ncbi:MAG: type II toxin-antitoxin system Phd/YefM family antitoxin [Proteobacteria bacterium]|nr:type II toxin-antitoxin system Phd/YefM family antitoxin [Pseudomonadota bacterium]
METIGVSRLRENIGMFLKKVEKGKVVTITSRGQEVAMLVPVEDKMESSRKALQQLRKSAVVGDVLSPVAEQWEAMK